MILAVDYRDRSNLLKLSNLKWVYIGSFRGSEYVKDILKESNRIFIGKLIEEVLDAVRDNFVNYIDMISQQQNNKVLWYSSRMASKSIQTSMFEQYVYLKVLEKFSEGSVEDTLIISDNREFFYNVGRIFSSKVKILNKEKLGLRSSYSKLSGYAKIARYCVFWFLSRFFKNNQIGVFDVLLHSWVDTRVFEKVPEYNDSYFRDLENVLTKAGYSVGRLTSLRVSLRNILKLNKYFNNIIYPLAYASLQDFLKCAFSKLTVTVDDQKLTSLDDIEILNTLLENEVCKENRTKIHLEYLLSFDSYKNISLKIKEDASLIYPFENQPYEKMINLAFAKFKRIAYQHSTIPYNWLNYRVSKDQNGACRPRIILTIGRKWSSFLKKYYTNSIIEEAGAVRFSYLFKEKPEKKHPNQTANIEEYFSRPNYSVFLKHIKKR